MDLSFSLLALAAAGANFYFLVRPERVQSLLMLRLSWAALGLSLVAVAFGGISKPGPEAFEGLLLARGIAFFFLGVSYLLLPCIVHPLELTSPVTPRHFTPSYESQALHELTANEAASEVKS